LRFYRLTTPFRPIDPLLCAHGAFPATKKCAVRLIRAVWFSPLDSLPESSGLPWQRDQNQREANAESFLIDTGIGEASILGVAQDL
jgi:hypothetical protein